MEGNAKWWSNGVLGFPVTPSLHYSITPVHPFCLRRAGGMGEEGMKVVVQGLWHLGCVTAACCAERHEVVGLDFDDLVVSNLREGNAPLFEPGLNDLIKTGLARKTLVFSHDPKQACAGADVLWLCYDTPVNEQDESDVDFVLQNLRRNLPHLPNGALVLISSQLPVGSCRKLEGEFPQFHFAYSPENLRLGKAIEAFTKPERVIVGQRSTAKQELIRELFKPFTSQVIFMRTESAEMVKHALNSFLALSITFINEIARLCERTGADAKEVAAGLKSDVRVGPRAYLGPGGPFAGGTLARDVVTLTKLAGSWELAKPNAMHADQDAVELVDIEFPPPAKSKAKCGDRIMPRADQSRSLCSRDGPGG